MENKNLLLSPSHGILTAAILMIFFGAAEVVTGFRHQFFTLTTTSSFAATVAGVSIGALYILSGLLILTRKKWAAGLAIFFLAADIAGRIAMVAARLYPIDTPLQSLAIILGTLIAGVFAVYIALHWKSFR